MTKRTDFVKRILSRTTAMKPGGDQAEKSIIKKKKGRILVYIWHFDEQLKPQENYLQLNNTKLIRWNYNIYAENDCEMLDVLKRKKTSSEAWNKCQQYEKLKQNKGTNHLSNVFLKT